MLGSQWEFVTCTRVLKVHFRMLISSDVLKSNILGNSKNKMPLGFSEIVYFRKSEDLGILKLYFFRISCVYQIPTVEEAP